MNHNHHYRLQNSYRHECAYKAIISLNNAGVSLMARRMYTDAAETLKDAIQLMRSTFFDGGDDGNSVPPPQDVFERALQAAWLRTRREGPQPQRDDGLNLVVLSDLANPRQVYEELGNDPDILFGVVIEPFIDDWSEEETIDMERLECESGLLLYNYGIAYRCCAARTTDPAMDADTRTRVLDAALCIFELSQTVVAGKSPMDCDDEEEDDERHSPLTRTASTGMLLSFLVTASLLQMSSNNVELCHQYREDLLDLLATLSQREILHSLDKVAGAAAAAA